MRYITPESIVGRFIAHPAPRWDIAVLSFRDTRGSATLVQRLGAEPVGYRCFWGLEESPDMPYAHQATIGGKRVGVISRCLWGGPQAAILVEELASLGVRHIIGYGAAGGISPDLRKGDQIVAVAGLETDGTSRAYNQGEVLRPDPELLALIPQVQAVLGLALIPTTIATVDAVYRETEAAVQGWLAMGADAINMETSALYAASAACGVASIWVGHISDCLHAGVWDGWNRGPAMADSTLEATAAMIELLPDQA